MSRYITFDTSKLTHRFATPMPKDELVQWYGNEESRLFRQFDSPGQKTRAQMARALGVCMSTRQELQAAEFSHALGFCRQHPDGMNLLVLE